MEPPSWDNLELFNIDLHFHAGTERPKGCSLHDFISFAVASGRRIIGVTDHFGRFTLGASARLNHYPGTLGGYRIFAKEVREEKDHFPGAIILFSPEIGLAHFESETGRSAMEEAEVDFIIGEPSRPDNGVELGDYLIRGMEVISEVREEYGVPGFLAHPLRALINDMLGKTGVGPKMPKQDPFPPLMSIGDPLSDVQELLGIDVRRLAAVSDSRNVPLEINQSSWGRILAMNHQSFAERYIYFLEEFIDSGGKLVLGSDIHNVENACPTPFVVSEKLGVDPGDIGFLEKWLGKR